MRNKIICSVLLVCSFTACNPEFDHPINEAGNYNPGTADFSSYVAVGNSITAGFMDGTVSRVGQSYSFPNILAKQFAVVGGGEFTQPSFDDDVNNLGGFFIKLAGLEPMEMPPRLIMNASVGGPENLKGTPTIGLTMQKQAYNNMGVSGAKSFHLVQIGYGNILLLLLRQANPYFVRHATTDNATVIQDAMTKDPTFFTNWIGNNDVLGYTTSGGVGSISGKGEQDITPIETFEASYKKIIDALTSEGAQGVVATIPDVIAIPFFTTIRYNSLSVAMLGGGNEEAGKVMINKLNKELYGPLIKILTELDQGDRINLLSETTANPLLIKDKDLEDLGTEITTAASGIPGLIPIADFLGKHYGQARQATSKDLVLLSTKLDIGKAPSTKDVPEKIPENLDKYGITYPLEDKHILIPSEIENAQEATRNFNDIIKGIAVEKNLAVADMNAIMTQLGSGLRQADGQIYTSDYFSPDKVSTVLFSLDGVHPNARGYAVIANEIIKVINQHFKANIPQVNAGGYPGATILLTNE